VSMSCGVEKLLSDASALADQNVLHPLQVSFKRKKKKQSLPVHSWLPLSFLISFHPCFCSVHFGEVCICRCCRRSRLGHGRWRMSRCWCLFKKMSRASFVRSPSSRVNLQRSAMLRRWPRRSSAICLMHWLMVRGG
jgi:hypothetical protein